MLSSLHVLRPGPVRSRCVKAQRLFSQFHGGAPGNFVHSSALRLVPPAASGICQGPSVSHLWLGGHADSGIRILSLSFEHRTRR